MGEVVVSMANSTLLQVSHFQATRGLNFEGIPKRCQKELRSAEVGIQNWPLAARPPLVISVLQFEQIILSESKRTRTSDLFNVNEAL